MTKARLKVTEEEQRALKWEHEVLEQRFEKVRNNSLINFELNASDNGKFTRVFKRTKTNFVRYWYL